MTRSPAAAHAASEQPACQPVHCKVNASSPVLVPVCFWSACAVGVVDQIGLKSKKRNCYLFLLLACGGPGVSGRFHQ